MKVCLKCNHKVKDSQKFCDNCGGNNFRVIPVQSTPKNQNQNQYQTQQTPVKPPVKPRINQRPNQTQVNYTQQSQFNQENENRFVDTPINNDISVKDWLVIFIMTIIPIWNIIYIVKNIKNTDTNPCKSNYLKAYAIYYGIAFVLSLIIALAL